MYTYEHSYTRAYIQSRKTHIHTHTHHFLFLSSLTACALNEKYSSRISSWSRPFLCQPLWNTAARNCTCTPPFQNRFRSASWNSRLHWLHCGKHEDRKKNRIYARTHAKEALRLTLNSNRGRTIYVLYMYIFIYTFTSVGFNTFYVE